MEQQIIIKKLKTEFRTLKQISKKQFEQRFSISKYEDRWADDIFNQYQNAQIRIDLLLELLIE